MSPANRALSALSSCGSTRRVSAEWARSVLVPAPTLLQCAASAETPDGHLLGDSAPGAACSIRQKKLLQGNVHGRGIIVVPTPARVCSFSQQFGKAQHNNVPIHPMQACPCCHKRIGGLELHFFDTTGAPSGHRAQGCWVRDKSTPETLTTACHAASWLARSCKCGWRIASMGPVTFLGAEAKNCPETSVPNSDAWR